MSLKDIQYSIFVKKIIPSHKNFSIYGINSELYLVKLHLSSHSFKITPTEIIDHEDSSEFEDFLNSISEEEGDKFFIKMFDVFGEKERRERRIRSYMRIKEKIILKFNF